MIIRLLKKWFGKKNEEVKERKRKPSSLFFEIPIGARINGLIKFKPSSASYFLLNEDKMLTKLPDEKTQVVVSISKFNLFGLMIYRAYIEVGNSYLQFHYDLDGKLLDILYFKNIETINVTNNPSEKKKWKGIIGDEDIITPNGVKFLRDWSPDEKGHIPATPVNELKFSDPFESSYVGHEMMLYSKLLEGGGEDDIEYLLAEMISFAGKTEVKIQTGIRLEPTDLEIM